MNFTTVSYDLSETTSKASISDFKYWDGVSWKAAVSINGVLTVLTLWILFSLVHFGVKTGKWRGSQKRHADKLNAGWIYSSVIMCAVMAIIRYTTSQITTNLGFDAMQNDLCEAVNDALFVEYSLVLFSNYVFLWLRQRAFYTNEMFNITYGRSLRFLSAFSILILAVAGIGVNLVNTIPINYPANFRGCYYDKGSDTVDKWSWALCAVVLVIGQAMLLSLLLYPLARHQNKKNCLKQLCCYVEPEKEKRISCNPSDLSSSPDISIFNDERNVRKHANQAKLAFKSTDESNKAHARSTQKEKKRSKNSKAVQKIMIRTLGFGFLAVCTDIFLIVILSTSILDQSDPKLRRVSVTLYDINVFLNLMLVVMSFVTYRHMLSSPFRRLQNEEITSKQTTSFL